MHIRKLDNGMTFVSIANPNLNSAVVMVGVQVGSRNEWKEMHGASHFIEHMLFKGTKKRPSAKALSSLIESRGGYNNAYTDKELTNFFIQMSKHDVNLAVDIVHDMLQNSLFRSSDVDNERPVIQEEIASYDNDPDTKAWHTSESVAFNGTALEHPIAGTVESVKFSSSKLRDFYRFHYVPEKMVVVLSGAFSKETEKLAIQKFQSLREAHGYKYDDKMSYQWSEHVYSGLTCPPCATPKGGFTFVEGKTDRMHVIFRLPGAAKFTKESRLLELAVSAFGGNSSSRLFQMAREKKGLCYGIQAHHHSYSDVGSVVVTTDTEQGKFPEMIKTIKSELNKLKRRGITAQELKDAKTQLRGMTLLSLDRPMSLAESVIYQAFASDEIHHPNSMLGHYTRLRLGDVNEAVAGLNNAHVTVVGPAASEKLARKVCEG